jgi:hypothetical protein
VILRTLGLRTQELAAGPYRFLLSDSTPVAYTDGTQWYVTEQYHNKGTTKRINKWLIVNNQIPGRQAKQSQSAISELFMGLDRYSVEQPEERRQGGRRELDQTPPTVMRLAEALSAVLQNGRGT